MARTQEERKAETRSRLIDAAAELFARRGFDAVSAETLADAADRTTGALYAHFGGKEGLLLAVLETWKSETLAAIGEELDAAPDLDARLAALWAKFAADDGGRHEAQQLLEHELWLYGARNSDAAEVVATRLAHDRSNMATGLREWQAEAGVTPQPQTDHDAALAMGLLLGLAMQRRVDPASVPDELAITGLRKLLGIPR